MGGLFSSDVPDPEPPATMPDPEDPLAKRQRRRQVGELGTTSSSASNKLAPVAGTLSGREYTRSTLGAS